MSSQPALSGVTFAGAGPGSADMLTLGVFRALQQADVVIHDRLVGAEVLDMIPASATRVDAGKEGFGPSTPQSAINALIVGHAGTGARVVRLKGGDPGIFGRLDEEIEALEAAGIPFTILPGLTSATVAAAAIGQSLTKRGRNRGVRIVTGHDIDGFADQDWKGLARAGEVAAIYMGKKASRFLQGRLMMHGASPDTPVTLVENASRPDQRIVRATLCTLADHAAGLTGPAILLYGIAPRAAVQALTDLNEATA
ncbi:uroporphyrinogen-III C-methyltransferase [Falsirhodobacter deserti]|uniref:uroporphyrinogen-III C-methyltransferase n=1 Tax=Falsirhodobacter deserti TaxID=1365611 RepID=UPI000FE2D895|nr:uroporphyrinogen-III C-methyltransferase [Falsirhodobacter deserti]